MADNSRGAAQATIDILQLEGVTVADRTLLVGATEQRSTTLTLDPQYGESGVARFSVSCPGKAGTASCSIPWRRGTHAVTVGNIVLRMVRRLAPGAALTCTQTRSGPDAGPRAYRHRLDG